MYVSVRSWSTRTSRVCRNPCCVGQDLTCCNWRALWKRASSVRILVFGIYFNTFLNIVCVYQEEPQTLSLLSALYFSGIFFDGCSNSGLKCLCYPLLDAIVTSRFSWIAGGFMLYGKLPAGLEMTPTQRTPYIAPIDPSLMPVSPNRIYRRRVAISKIANARSGR